MKKLWLLSFIIGLAGYSFGQTCTISGSGTIGWNNASPPACQEGGNADSASIIIIPTGVNLDFNSNGDTWTGTRIEVYGTFTVSFDVVINASLVVRSGGLANISKKLDLGTAATSPCPYTVIIESGGTVDVDGTGTDRLNICGTPIMKGSGACNDCGGTNSGTCAHNGQPYCEPSGGFQGPLGYSEDGFDGSLPVKLSFFNATSIDNRIVINWATIMEENFEKFIIQRSSNGVNFTEIGEQPGQGYDIFDIETKYSFEDKAPFLGFNYYRLKAVDLDGSFEYFGPKAAKISGGKRLAVSPNPSPGESISFSTNFNPGESDFVVIIDQLGTELLRVPASALQNKITLDNQLKPGVYFLKYVSSDFQEVARVFVKN